MIDIVLWLFLTVPWVGLQCVIVVLPDHTHFFVGFTCIFVIYTGTHGRLAVFAKFIIIKQLCYKFTSET